MSSNGKMLSERVADEIIEMITIQKRFNPGDKLPNENDLSAEMGVSRTTLREAVRFLVAHHILEIKRGKGTFVTHNKELIHDYGFGELDNVILKLKDLYEMRLIFEPQIAYLAAKRATDKEMEKILEYGRKTEDKILKGEDRTEDDQAFHNAIAKAAHNDLVKRLMPILNNGISNGVKVTPMKPVILQHTLRDHRNLMEFLRERDPDGARLAMQLHLSHVIKEFNLEDK